MEDIEKNTEGSKKPTLGRLFLLFMMVFLAAKLFGKLGLSSNFSIGAGLGFGAALVVGLIASVSSCLAINGGLILSTAASYNERYGKSSGLARMQPVLMFVTGRIASYALLGGALGLLGKALTPSPLVTALITIAAAIYMLGMGLEMLKISPAWLKRIMPGMPKSLSHKVLDAQEKNNPLMPAIIGGLTFFLPCGFTQALQLYALTTGSAWQSALILGAFALGTAPALLALGFAGSSLKGKTGQLFYQFSGALVILLGLWNMQNALAIAGYPINLPKFTASTIAKTDDSQPTVNPTGDVQVVQMKVNAGYTPSNPTIKVGVPVRWEVDGSQARGCDKVLVSRELGIQKVLDPGINIFNFTPTKAGTIQFSCSMGMYRGSFTVVN